MLKGHSGTQLKYMIDLINKGYPHLKIAKTGNKAELINRIVTANSCIKATNSTSSSRQAVSSEPAVNQQPAKRAKHGEKNAYLTLINNYNTAQVTAHNVSRRGKVVRLSRGGRAEDMRSRLIQAGVEVPDF